MNLSIAENLIDSLVYSAELEEGRTPDFIKANGGGMAYVTGIRQKPKRFRRYPKWSAAEDQYLRDNLGRITEEDIAAHLGRTIVAVHLRWKRDLHLCSPSKHPDYLTGQKAAKLLGIDEHKIMHWCDVGMIPARRMAGTRKGHERVIRLIFKISFYRWVISPSNWIYFDWKKIPDQHLRRLCELRAERWGDEWWTTVETANYHGVDSKDVQRLIYRNEIPGIQVATSRGGRHKDPAWLNWYVKKSDAVKAVFLRGRGNWRVNFTDRAQAWIMKAYRMGIPYAGIARSMGRPQSNETIRKFIIRKLAEQKT